MALMVLFCIYLMVLWWRCGDTFEFYLVFNQAEFTVTLPLSVLYSISAELRLRRLDDCLQLGVYVAVWRHSRRFAFVHTVKGKMAK